MENQIVYCYFLGDIYEYNNLVQLLEALGIQEFENSNENLTMTISDYQKRIIETSAIVYEQKLEVGK